MWSDDRSNIHGQNVKALLMRKSNIDLACTEFYENIKSNVVLIKKVLSTDLLINVIRLFLLYLVPLGNCNG